MVANATDAKGQAITLAKDGGLWVGEDFYPLPINAKGKIALPLIGDTPDDVPLILEALGI